MAFDPDKYLGTPPETSAAPAPAGFDPDAYLGTASPTVAQPAAPTPPFDPDKYLGAVDKEIQDRSFFNRPAVTPETIKDSEIQEIAAKHGVDPAELRSKAPFFGANLEGSEGVLSDAAKGTAGFVGQLALGVPQKIYKKTQSPEMEKALDDLQSLAAGRESYTGLIAQTAAPSGAAGAGSSGLGALASSVGVGAIAGAAGAGAGEEAQGALFGAGVGGALHGVVHGLSRYLDSKATPVEKQLAKNVVADSAPDIEKGAQDILDSRSASAKDIEAHVLGQGADLDDQVAQAIVKDRVSPETLERMTGNSEEAILMQERAVREIPDVVQDLGEQRATQRLMAQDIIDSDRKDFAEYLSSKPARSSEEAEEAIQHYAQAQGGDKALADQFGIFSKERAANEFVAENHLRPGREDNWGNRTLGQISDAQFVLRDIDNRTGLGIEPIHRDLNRQINRMSYPRQAFRNDLGAIAKAARATGVDEAIVGTDKIYNALDTGISHDLTPQEQDIAQAFRDYFRKGLAFVNGAVREGKGDTDLTPLSIRARENYVPYQLKRPRELQTLIDQRLGSLDLSQVTDKGRFQGLLAENPELLEVVHGIGRLDEGGPASTGPELLARIHDLFDSKEGRKILETQASAALERQGEALPDWMREKNLYKLADSWSSSTLRHLYLRKPVDQLASKLRTLRKTGATLESTYLQNLLTDLQGIRAGTAGSFVASIEDKYSRAIDHALGTNPGPTGRAAAGALKSLPEIFSDMNKQIYPNLLGLSVKAILMNSTQPLAKTLPEIGLTPYGSAALLRGSTLALAGFHTMMKRAETQGLGPAEFVGGFRRVMAEGIRRSSLYAVPQEILAKMSEAALHLYSRMDTLNRAIVIGTADVIASDLAHGSTHAQAALARLPGSVRKAVASAATEKEVSDILASHLNASTQYNYNRASMSEFGRTMGPFFSTFTKWPTATAGEIIAEYREKGLTRGTLRNMEKYLAPLLLLKGADVLLHHALGNKDGEYTDRQALVLGKSGLASGAPLGAGASILEGKLFAPPALDLLLNGVLRPAVKGDTSKLRKTLTTGIQDFAPGAGYIRFLTQDLTTMMTGHKPEGDFIEKTVQGARTLKKIGQP